MSAGGVLPAGSSRVLRLDPFALPVRFSASDAAADGRVRIVELHRERVIVRRAVAGMRMAVSLSVADFLGVAIRLIAPEGSHAGGVAVVLEHRDAALAVPVFVASDGAEALAEWKLWGKVLGLPLLVADAAGQLCDPFARLGALRVATALPRRRRYGTVRSRRPRILLRRKPGTPGVPQVHRGEREIIARD